MKSPATVRPDERLRLFCALPLPEDALERLVAWQAEAFSRVPAVRVVPRPNLHVTLAFLGSVPTPETARIVEAIRSAVQGVGAPVLAAARYRVTPRVGMLVLAAEEGRASRLAARLGRRLERLGVYERERREWLPHLTVVRFRRPPALAPTVPELGRFSPSDAALYTSSLRRSGAHYEVLESVALGG